MIISDNIIVHTTLERRIEALEKALSERPEEISVIMDYAEAAMSRGLFLKALQAFQKALKSPSEREEEAHFGLARIYFSRGLTKEAFEELAKVQETNPVSVSGWALSRFLLKKLSGPEAEGLSRLWADFEPDEESKKNFIRKLAGRKNILETEIKEYHSLLQESPSDPYLSYALRMCQRREEELASFLAEFSGISMPSEEAPLLPAERAEAGKTDAARGEAFEALREELGLILDGLVQAKGVTGVIVSSLDAELSLISSQETPDVKSIISRVKEGLTQIASWEKKDGQRELVHWVLEFEGGSLIVQPLAGDFVLLVISQKGANFGAIRYAVERARPKLTEVLSKAIMPAAR